VRNSLLFLLTLTVAVGCRNGESAVERETSTSTSQANASTPGSSAVDSLGLTFSLSPSFTIFQDPDLTFLARSTQPPAIFSIERASADVVDHGPEANESLTPMQLGGVDAVVVTNASVEGLPPGVVANELLVANGSRSFTAILSAGEQDLASLWNEFIASIRVTPG
jgi:hypothetical protein